MATTPGGRSGNERFTFLARYGATILRGGIAAIPTALYRYQGELKLAPQHVWFISAILARKWDADLPYPSLRRMASETAVSEQQLHNYKRQLVEAGWLVIINRHNRLGGQDTNFYDFGSLFGRLEELLSRDRAPQLAEGALNSSWETPLNPSLETPLNPGLDQFEEALVEPSKDSALSKPAIQAFPENPDGPDSKFRKGSRLNNLAASRGVLTASRQPLEGDERVVPVTQSVLPDPASPALRRSNFRKSLSQQTAVAPVTLDPPASTRSSTETPGQADTNDRMDRVYAALKQAGIEVHRAPLRDEREAEQTGRAELPPATDEDADPEYIDNIIRDISAELRDSKHTRSNVTQARRLWEASGMTVLDFKDALYDVRRVVRLQPGVENRMAYYFKCLKVVFGMERNPNPNPIRPQGTKNGQMPTSEQPADRQSLAGRYAHLVQH